MSDLIRYLTPDSISTVLFILALVAMFIYYKYTTNKVQAKNIILALVNEAERKFGKGNGSVKYSYVVDKVYPLLPLVIRLFITETLLGQLIEEAVLILKENLNKDSTTS